MKEIKAYVNRTRVNSLVKRLQAEGAPGITVVEVHPVGHGFEPAAFELDSTHRDVLRLRAHRIVKLEVVCCASEVNTLLQIIKTEARTGSKGDGMIFVSDIAAAIRIRDGLVGRAAL